MPATHQSIFLFGAGHTDLPALPDGFRYEQHPKLFLTATDGVREYYVCKPDHGGAELIRRRYTTPDDIRRSEGKLKPGSTWIDHTDRIALDDDAKLNL